MGGTAYAVCLAGCVVEAIEARPLLCEGVLVEDGKVPCLSGLVFCSWAATDCSGCLLFGFLRRSDSIPYNRHETGEAKPRSSHQHDDQEHRVERAKVLLFVHVVEVLHNQPSSKEQYDHVLE